MTIKVIIFFCRYSCVSVYIVPTGVAYGKYPKFDELMAMTQGVFFQDHLIQEFIPSMPHLHQQLRKYGADDTTSIISSSD